MPGSGEQNTIESTGVSAYEDTDLTNGTGNQKSLDGRTVEGSTFQYR